MKKTQIGHHSYDYFIRKSSDKELHSGKESVIGYIREAIDEVNRHETKIVQADILSIVEEINKIKYIKREATKKEIKQTEKENNNEEEEKEKEY